ncbi:MAG: glutamine--fructose-6-phosphate transaminase (isomerizing) [Porticoccaceae bacterium]
MCGIVGAVTERNVTPILMEGLRRLEYRGYDSAGLAVLLESDSSLAVNKSLGKVSELDALVKQSDIAGPIGIAHTRWATHGIPSTINAHPHTSGELAVVHNGIIENHSSLRKELEGQGYQFVSETDSEVVAHILDREFRQTGSMIDALHQTLSRIEGAYALCIINSAEPEKIYIARCGSPLVLGLGIGENYVASDQLALRPVTDRFVFLKEGDFGFISKQEVCIFDQAGEPVSREASQIKEDAFDADKGHFRHYMLKEIYEQPDVIEKTIEGRLGASGVLLPSFGVGVPEIFRELESITLVACGTSYHACLVAKQWIEDYLEIPAVVEIASEYRYRKILVAKNCLYISVSQSGETADTLAALQKSKDLGYLASLAVCNVASSSLVRESDHALLTRAGPEIGVASTKAFTTQLVALLILVAGIARAKEVYPEAQQEISEGLKQLPDLARKLLDLDVKLQQLSYRFADKHHALFLGRGIHYPVAKEGALKLKEISYIHAEAYPAGELKHGPLALVDSEMPVIAVAPHSDILEKIKSNLEEVKARGGQLYVLADAHAGFSSDDSTTVIDMPHVPDVIEPIIYSIPLQLLAYHVAIVKGTDVDQPRNLAKSVTVE